MLALGNIEIYSEAPNMTETNGNGSNGNGAITIGHAEVPYRGDVIVDSSVLFKLSSKILQKDAALNNIEIETPTFLNVIPFLEKNGYRVVIPEMVLAETGQISANGFDLRSFFQDWITDRERAMLKVKGLDLSELKLAGYRQDILGKFTKDILYSSGALQKKSHNVNKSNYIFPRTGPDKIEYFFKEMDRIAKEYYEMVKYSSKPGYMDKAREFALKEIKKLMTVKRHDKRNNVQYGDEAILSLIESDYKNISNEKKVFLLVDDNDLMQRVKGLSKNVEIVTASALIYSLVGAGLRPELGMDGSFSAAVLDQHCTEFADECTRQERIVKGLPPIKQEPKNDRQYDKSASCPIFAKSLKQLAVDLKKAKPAEDVSIGGSNGNGGGSDRVAKFYEKYGKKSTQLGTTPSR